MIPGIDVSHWQHEIDWLEVKRSGVKFAFIKATEFPDKQTALFVDNKFQVNLEGAKANGLYWGAYHFFRTHIDPVLQAQMFCETVGDFSSLPPVIDLEAAGSRGERLNYKVRLFLDEVQKATERRPIIFTSGGFWHSFMASEKRSHTDWAAEYPLWMAQKTTLWPTPIYPWAAWDFWQHSDKGRLPGIMTNVNLNWFAGSEEELVQKFIQRDREQPPVYIFEDEEHGRIPVVIKKAPPVLIEDNEKLKNDQKQVVKVAPAGFKPIRKPTTPKYSSDQENWIKEYFF